MHKHSLLQPHSTCKASERSGPHIQTQQECRCTQMFAQYVKTRWEADNFFYKKKFQHVQRVSALKKSTPSPPFPPPSPPHPPPPHVCFHLAEAVRRRAAAALTALFTETNCFGFMAASHCECVHDWAVINTYLTPIITLSQPIHR